jgi:hypothetical protein
MKYALLFLVACGSAELPPKPDVSHMGPDQKCLATAPRGTQCSNELLTGELGALGEQMGGDREFTREIGDQIEHDPATPRDALRMHRTRCAGDKRYADHLVRCWDVADCKALAACVYKTGDPRR